MQGPDGEFLKMFSQAWAKSPDSLKIQAEQTFDCCGLGINLETGKTDPTPTPDDIAWSIEHKVFDNYPYAKCHHNASGSTSKDCQTCFSLITDKVCDAHCLNGFFQLPTTPGQLWLQWCWWSWPFLFILRGLFVFPLIANSYFLIEAPSNY